MTIRDETIYLEMTRSDLLDDLSRTFKEQNNISALSNSKLVTAWKMHGIHAGTWDWDVIIVINDTGDVVYCEEW